MTFVRNAAAALALGALTAVAQASAVYTTSQFGVFGDFHINGANLTSMRALITASNTLTTGADFASAATLAGFDALWVNDRYGTAASAAEVNAIRGFISGGKKAVIITDNDGWAAWNNSIEAITGGVITDICSGGNGTRLVTNDLTQGAPTLASNSCNSLLNAGPDLEMLYSNRMAGVYTVGSGQALVLTSVDILYNTGQAGSYGIASNQQFAANIAAWLDQPLAGQAVPAPPSLALALLGLLAIPAFRRRG